MATMNFMGMPVIQSEKQIDASFMGGFKVLKTEPNVLDGVASAYCYKLELLNPELLGQVIEFDNDLDVFSFQSVNKRRALKKNEWPVAIEQPSAFPNRLKVNVHLIAGDIEIKTCNGCAKWKEKTLRPFLILTPSGNRCIKFSKRPTLLIIFRCCPKFHSFAKEFKLLITISCVSTPGSRLQAQIPIHRKRMLPSTPTSVLGKRKGSEEDETESEVNFSPSSVSSGGTPPCEEVDGGDPQVIAAKEPAILPLSPSVVTTPISWQSGFIRIPVGNEPISVPPLSAVPFMQSTLGNLNNLHPTANQVYDVIDILYEAKKYHQQCYMLLCESIRQSLAPQNHSNTSEPPTKKEKLFHQPQMQSNVNAVEHSLEDDSVFLESLFDPDSFSHSCDD